MNRRDNAPVTSLRAPARVRAPELAGRGWLNAPPLTLRALRGKVVLLDFWTFCCVNCLHVLDELRPLEREFADSLVVVGVHSPKFAHEADPAALAAAVQRYEVHHPVLDDPELATWQAYAVRAWPTLVVIDPEGYVVAQASGEGHGPGLAGLVAELIAEHEARGTLHRGDGPYQAPPEPAGALRFPGKLLALPGGSLLVSDTGHHTLVELAPDLTTVLRRIGTGERGLADGGPDTARFAEPQGLCLLDDGSVLVADTANHALRRVSPADGTVRTVAGTGEPLLPGDPQPGGKLSSPWDLARHGEAVIVAMAGTHQLWRHDPASGRTEVWAGTTAEGLVDGELAAAWFAQPSGLAADGDRLWLADAETSALRCATNGTVRTAVGHGLFDFGHRDGPAAEALLQHPLGVCVLPDGSVAVCDTYNDAIRRYDPATGMVSTLATDLREPSAAVVDGGTLIVVESAAHRLTRVPLPRVALVVDGAARRTQRPPVDLPPGPVRLEVVFTPPAGQHLDDRYGPSTHLSVSAAPAGLLAAGAGPGTALVRELELAGGAELAGVGAAGGEAVLHVSVRAASCDDGGGPDGHPACHVHMQDWGIPVRLRPGAPAELRLVLRG